jgi:hypothetical protein
MKIIGLMPVRNESWVLAHSLASLSGFCDVVIVSDQRSDDDSREICRRFPKVVLLESTTAGVCEQARWQLLDAARSYDGCNLWWWNDADELVSPTLVRGFLERDLAPGSAIDCPFYHLWGSAEWYRDDDSLYRPQRKHMAIVDDRHADFDRSSSLPLHQPRVEVSDDSRIVRADDAHVLHLQWLIAERNQMKQAWYRCRELLNGDRAVIDINRKYSITLPAPHARVSPVPRSWVADLTFPDVDAADRESTWQEREVLAWFDERGPEFFEPLEIWHIAVLRAAFERRAGRRPRPDLSYQPTLTARARAFAGRAVRAGRRRIAF